MEKKALPEIYNMSTTSKFILFREDTILVDRSSDWGNPFVMHTESNRDYVCDMFIKYANWRLSIDPLWLKPLKDKNLVCHCVPKRCHAETLRRLAND